MNLRVGKDAGVRRINGNYDIYTYVSDQLNVVELKLIYLIHYKYLILFYFFIFYFSISKIKKYLIFYS